AHRPSGRHESMRERVDYAQGVDRVQRRGVLRLPADDLPQDVEVRADREIHLHAVKAAEVPGDDVVVVRAQEVAERYEEGKLLGVWKVEELWLQQGPQLPLHRPRQETVSDTARLRLRGEDSDHRFGELQQIAKRPSRRRHIRAVSASAQPCIGPVRENADLLRPEIGARHKGLILADADRLEEANLSVIDQRLPEQLPRRKRPVHIVIDEIRIESRCPENWPRHYSAVDPCTLAKDNIRPFRLCNLHKIAERVLRELVVGIEEEQVLSSCLLDPMVARASGATGISLM